MYIATVNFIFASIFVSLAWWSLPRGWNFTRLGWRALKEQSGSNSGLSFFLAGLGWLIAGILAVIIAVVLGVIAIIQFRNPA